LQDTISTEKKLGLVNVPVIPPITGIIKENCGPGPPGQKVRPYLQNNQRKKGARGMTQVVECLPCKHKTLSSNPVQKKKKT
jgi:hypothetical protein